MRPVLCLLTLFLGGLQGCHKRDAVLLHKVNSFAGTVEITTPDGMVLVGELTFDRHAGHRQWVRRGDETIALSRPAGGVLALFVDGVPQPVVGPEAAAAFTVVERVLDADPAEVSMQGDGYRLADRHQVRILSVPKPHGG